MLKVCNYFNCKSEVESSSLVWLRYCRWMRICDTVWRWTHALSLAQFYLPHITINDELDHWEHKCSKEQQNSTFGYVHRRCKSLIRVRISRRQAGVIAWISVQPTDKVLHWKAFAIVTVGDALASSTQAVYIQTWWGGGGGGTFTDELTLGSGEMRGTETATVAEHAVGHDHLSAVETRTAAHAGLDSWRHQQTNTRQHQQWRHLPVTWTCSSW